jgi:hypothetical protein
LKPPTVLAVALLGLAPCGASQAQPMQPAYPGYYPGLFGGVAPSEVVTIVRSKGLEPLSRPIRQGPAYTLRASDPQGRIVQVVVDARIGRIVRVVPTTRADAVAPPPYPIPTPPDRAVPDGNGANSRTAVVPPYPDDDFEPLERSPAAAAPRQSARALPPPLPRPRPNDIEPTAVPSASASADATPPFTELEE